VKLPRFRFVAGSSASLRTRRRDDATTGALAPELGRGFAAVRYPADHLAGAALALGK
jgi:hypothetical protein